MAVVYYLRAAATIEAPPQAVFDLVAAIETYPLLIPHHRGVDLLAESEEASGARRAQPPRAW